MCPEHGDASVSYSFTSCLLCCLMRTIRSSRRFEALMGNARFSFLSPFEYWESSNLIWNWNSKSWRGLGELGPHSSFILCLRTSRWLLCQPGEHVSGSFFNVRSMFHWVLWFHCTVARLLKLNLKTKMKHQSQIGENKFLNWSRHKLTLILQESTYSSNSFSAL